MKKNAFLFAALAAVLTCSCNVEQPVDVPSDEDGEITVLAAGFAGADTKTVRQSDGKVFWSPNDEISVMRNSTSSANKKFVASNTEPAAETYFTGIMPAGTGAYWAVYPYNANNSIQNGYFVTSVPAKQEAVAGSFANNVFVSAAYEKNATKTLTFHHQCGGVKFTVTQPGIKSAVVVPADESVSLAGLVGLYAASAGSAPYIRATGSPEDMSSTVELVAPEGETLEVGEAYHIVTIPATLKGGFSLMLQKEDGTVCFRKVSKDVKIEAGHFLTLKDVDEGAEFDRYFEFSPSTIEVEPVGGLFTMNIRSTVDFHVQINDDWIKQVSVTGDPRLGATVTFSAEMNTGEERSGVMIVCDDKNCYPVVVTQGDGSKLKKVTHHSLGMRFTATWCGYCPIMSKTFHLAKDNLGDKFEYICMYDRRPLRGGELQLRVCCGSDRLRRRGDGNQLSGGDGHRPGNQPVRPEPDGQGGSVCQLCRNLQADGHPDGERHHRLPGRLYRRQPPGLPARPGGPEDLDLLHLRRFLLHQRGGRDQVLHLHLHRACEL